MIGFVAMQFLKIRGLLLRALQPNRKTHFIKGDEGGGDTPLPIPNREVKPASADGTAGETLWESRSSPIFYFVLADQPVSPSAVSFWPLGGRGRLLFVVWFWGIESC